MIRPELFSTHLGNFFSSISQSISPNYMKDFFINFMMVEYLNLHYTRSAKTLYVMAKSGQPFTLPIVGFEFTYDERHKSPGVRIHIGAAPTDRNICGELIRRFGNVVFMVESIVDKDERNVGMGRIDISATDLSVLDTLIRMAYADAVEFMKAMSHVSPRPAAKVIESGETMYSPSYANPVSAVAIVKYQYPCNDQGHDTCVYFVAEDRERSVYSGTLLTFEEFFDRMDARPAPFLLDPVSDDEAALLKRFVDIMSSKEDKS